MVDSCSSFRFLSFGEAMLRFAPAGKHDDWRGKPSCMSTCTRAVGGDELNVCVALARLGRDASWASVLPSGPLGDVVKICAADAKVRLNHLVEVEGGDIGTYHMMPESSSVHYQRKNSAFGKQQQGAWDWSRVIAERKGDNASVWLHVTGISPLICDNAAENWRQAVRAADVAGATVSVDFNYRPQLGTIEKLWSVVEPEIPRIHLLVVSAHSLHSLNSLLHLEADCATSAGRQAGCAFSAGDDATSSVLPALKRLHAKLNGPAVAICLKVRGDDQRQRRWSIIIDADGVHSTEVTPTEHVPKDECGGGSAWCAGCIDRLSTDLLATGSSTPKRRDGVVALGSASAVAAARRGDILAALAQESAGDNSQATRADLEAEEQACEGKRACVDGLRVSWSRTGTVKRAWDDNAMVATAEPVAKKRRLESIVEQLEKAKVIAILRAKNEERAIARAIELADMGFKAIEVTCDSAGFQEERLLPALIRAVGQRMLVGVGTVMCLEDLEKAARGSASFALSPVRPCAFKGGWSTADGSNFVLECHQRGILAMPAAFTPQEIYECVEVYGALIVKVFPAQLWSPSALRDLKRVGCFGSYRLCPSGGIDCENAEAWLAAGASSVGMGSCLVGKDTAVTPGDSVALAAAEEEWKTKAKPKAEEFAKRLSLK
eukprot:TRINITY_DN15423_c0_g1_i1.p1 TRINITY_DN15423_c0_g1~~TRINITY_DN15423_c0_g1_i1.p1  ORF type:complete len:682 (-),score=122.96 TRINITY_DN15423_c0_g1_i1:141-2126(-)